MKLLRQVIMKLKFHIKLENPIRHGEDHNCFGYSRYFLLFILRISQDS